MSNAITQSPVLVRLSDVEPEEVQWLWRRRVPLGKLTLFVGDPDATKSFLTVDMGARVSCGAPWPDIPDETTEKGAVILLNAEDDLADTIRPRLDAAQADPSRVVALTATRHLGQDREYYFSLESDLPSLEEAIARENARLVVVDPITAYLGKANSHNNADIRGLLAPLAGIAAYHRCAVVAITHLNKTQDSKNGARRALYRPMGSLAFVAAARVAWLIAKDPDDPERRLFLPLKNNLSKKPSGLAYRIVDPGRVEWEQTPVESDADTVLNTQGGRITKIEKAQIWLGAILSRGPLRATTIESRAQKANIAPKTLERAKTALGVTTRRVGFGKNGCWTWSLPP